MTHPFKDTISGNVKVSLTCPSAALTEGIITPEETITMRIKYADNAHHSPISD